MKISRSWFVFPSLALALLAFSLIGDTLTANAAPPSSPFKGMWESTDNDGSSQTLLIKLKGKSGKAKLFLYDDGASVCGLDANGEPIYAARGKGNGLVSPTTLDARLRIKCLSVPPTFPGFTPMTYTYDPITDTLTDSTAVVWTRVP
jgi:hypothetical protein